LHNLQREIYYFRRSSRNISLKKRKRGAYQERVHPPSSRCRKKMDEKWLALVWNSF